MLATTFLEQNHLWPKLIIRIACFNPLSNECKSMFKSGDLNLKILKMSPQVICMVLYMEKVAD